jgi:hypothetical protein
MSNDEYYYISTDQVPDERLGPMLVERSMLDVAEDEDVTLARLRKTIRRYRQERGADVGIFVTIAAVMPATPWKEPK